MGIRATVLRTGKRAALGLTARSPFRDAALTQLPYVLPGAPRLVEVRDRLTSKRARELGLADLERTMPCSDAEHHRPCPLCGAERVRLRHHPVRYDAAGAAMWAYRVGECPDCDLFYRVPSLRPERVPELYETGEYADYLEGSYAKNRRRQYAATLDAFSPVFDDGAGRRLLDFGCGTGLFMQVAAKRGFDPYGLDLAPDAVAVAKRRFGDGRAVCGTAEDVAASMGGGFDVITMWSVLAHIPDPRAELEGLLGLLAPGGRLLIYTVNAMSLQRQAFGGRWTGFTPGHLIFWHRETLTRLLTEVGFARVDFADFCGLAIERGTSRLTPRHEERYRTVADGGRGNMMRALATSDGA